MKLTLVTEPEISFDRIQLPTYLPQGLMDWLLNRPKKVMSSQIFMGKISLGKFHVSSDCPLAVGQKLNATFGTRNYIGIMPLHRVGTSSNHYTYQCCVDHIEETK